MSPRALPPCPVPAATPLYPPPQSMCRLAHRAPPIPRPARRSASVRNGTDTSSSFYDDDDDDDTTDEIYRYGVGPAGDVSVRARPPSPHFTSSSHSRQKKVSEGARCPEVAPRPVAHLPPPASTARPRRMTITTRKTVAGRVRADERTVRDARPNFPPPRGSLVPSPRTHRAFLRGTKHPTPRSV